MYERRGHPFLRKLEQISYNYFLSNPFWRTAPIFSCIVVGLGSHPRCSMCCMFWILIHISSLAFGPARTVFG
jgi:hypothetical protein